MQITTQSTDQTLALGRLIGRLAPPPPAVTCIALDGPLGAGKTHLTRGIAEGAGVDDPSLVSSPTYVLLNVYTGPKPVYHLDAYRVHGAGDFAAVGFEELLAGGGTGGVAAVSGGIVIVEWASRVTEFLPADCLRIAIEHEGEDNSDTRSFHLEASGPASNALLAAISKANEVART